MSELPPSPRQRLRKALLDCGKRADAAEARVKVLEEAMAAAVRAANLALFVIKKHGVMPNDSWETGFEADLAVARAALASKEEGGR